MGKTERDKGARYERYIRMKFQDTFDLISKICNQPQEHVTRGNQKHQAFQPDVIIPDYWIECTHSKNPRINAKIKQALKDLCHTPDNEHKSKIPAIVSRQDRQEDWVTIPLSHFLQLIENTKILENGMDTRGWD